MKKVLINETFKDVYTGRMRTAGDICEMTDERIKEIKEVNPNFVTVIGKAETVEETEVEEVEDIAEDIAEDEAAGKPKRKTTKK